MSEPLAENHKSRWAVVLGSSYAVSALVHVGLLVIASLLFSGAPARVKEKVAAILPRFEKKEPPFDRDRPPALERQEKVDRPPADLVFKSLDEKPPTDDPKGEPTGATDKPLDLPAMPDDATGPGASGGGTPLGSRSGDKVGSVPDGGGPASEEVVTGALFWLVRHQDPETGGWSAADFDRHCKDGGCRGPDFRASTGDGPGRGDARYDVGVTSLALLAFLGNGHTHRHSPRREFKRAVKRGLDFLKSAQRDDGSVGLDGGGETIYNHAIATLALCEAYAISRDFTLRRPAQKAVDFAVTAQNPGLGWKYGVKVGKNDTSVTGWFVLALKAARIADLEVPDAAFAGALAWLDRATAEDGRVGYERAGDGGSQIARRSLPHPDRYPRFAPLPTMTAVGVLGRVFAGEKRTDARVQKGVRLLGEALPAWSEGERGSAVNLYYWYYATYAVFQATALGSPDWKRWNEAMRKALLPTVRRGGCEAGSWDPVDEWGIAGGRVYATAVGALTLEIYYRYERVVEPRPEDRSRRRYGPAQAPLGEDG